ncbi:MAG: hypothetical protein RLZZ117_418 [Cyanobacteriota bacterium]|jgi:uncharacterized membrane protein
MAERARFFEERRRLVRALLIGVALTALLLRWLRLQEAFPIAFLVAISQDQWLFVREGLRLDEAATRKAFSRLPGGRWLLLRGSIVFSFISIGLLSLCVNDLQSKNGPLPFALRTLLFFGCLFGTWLQLHNSFAMLYAKHYYRLNPQPCSEGVMPHGFIFSGDEEPMFSDFLYVSYTVGLTYSTSDTALESSGVRRIVLFHSLVSFLFFTTVLSALLNLLDAL